MSWYQQLNPPDQSDRSHKFRADEREPEADRPRQSDPPVVARVLGWLMVLAGTGSIAAAFLVLTKDKDGALWLTGAVSAFLGAWISRTTIVLLWRLVEAAEKRADSLPGFKKGGPP